MSKPSDIYKIIQRMRNNLEHNWNKYESLQAGEKTNSNTLEIKQAEDKTCAVIQKSIREEYPDDEELHRIAEGVTNV